MKLKSSLNVSSHVKTAEARDQDDRQAHLLTSPTTMYPSVRLFDRFYLVPNSVTNGYSLNISLDSSYLERICKQSSTTHFTQNHQTETRTQLLNYLKQLSAQRNPNNEMMQLTAFMNAKLQHRKAK